MFDALRAALHDRLPIERSGFTIADRLWYNRWLGIAPDFESRDHLLLKEWEITRAPSSAPDLARIASYERALGGEAGLFGALVADRRLFMGKDCAYSQDYRRRFSDAELLCILQRGLERTERLFDELRPTVLIGFICVTMLDYLAYLFARARGVRVLNLRPTRVADFVAFGSTLNDPSPEHAAAHARVLSEDTEAWVGAGLHIRQVREHHGRYEGVVKPSDKPALQVNAARRSPAASLVQVLRNYREYRTTDAIHDNHVADPLRTLFFAAIVNPARARFTAWRLSDGYRSPEDLRGVRYAFFPLHTEPEVSLLVYGRPYVNQIEVARAFATSLPADMFLVVKEHPWMVGKRKLSAYRKLLNIPKVILANPATEARSWIGAAELVTVITSSVALEAAILGKPVVTLGDCPYNLLPPGMLRHCSSPRELPRVVHELLDSYRCDETALQAYVASVLDTSASINLYSVLLQRRGVHAERSSSFAAEISKLAAYAVKCLDTPVPHSSAAAAAW